MALDALINEASAAILEGNKDAALDVAIRAIRSASNLVEIVDRGFTPGMIRAADLFAEEKMPLPGLLAAAEAMNAVLRTIQPHLCRKTTGTVIFGKKGMFFAQRVLARIQPLSQALNDMQSTRYTWPSLLWNIPTKVLESVSEP